RFLTRLRNKLALAERQGGCVHTATFLLGDRFSYARLALRCQIARLLSGTLLRTGGGQLMIFARKAAPGWSDHVFALATALEVEPGGQLEISIGLPEPLPAPGLASPRSGTYTATRQDADLSCVG